MLIDVRGTRLHVDQRGAKDAPPLLYLHGGPGSGSHDFMSFQGERLSERLRLVGVDQRGVQRSDPLDGPVTEDDLIADFEALREVLGFERWSILGHSYGGRLALLIKGGHDPVTSPEEISLFRECVPNGTFRLFESAGHFVHAEEAEEYARLVAAFVVGEVTR
ncbi:alpha/beta fold hydrolase [Nonomuraea sp. NPDC005983]|uniref:alpha/beta fold hydrolase n=1 Tax=Nonomuraea sp. NPDC005983 TaxID=3155595 RepID=UPI0033AD5F5F